MNKKHIKLKYRPVWDTINFIGKNRIVKITDCGWYREFETKKYIYSCYKKPLDKTQRVCKYMSGYGVPYYEIEQYNHNCDDWFIVGDTYNSKRIAKLFADHHNKKLLIK